MAQDEQDLFAFASEEAPTPQLSLYQFRGPVITTGRHTQLDALISARWRRQAQTWIVRRPTAGGAVLHAGGICFSLLFKNNQGKRAQHALVTTHLKPITRALRCLGIQASILNSSSPVTRARLGRWCTFERAQSDLVMGKQKIGGVGQRIYKDGILLQGYLTLRKRECEWMKRLVPPPFQLGATIRPTSVESVTGRLINPDTLYRAIEHEFVNHSATPRLYVRARQPQPA